MSPSTASFKRGEKFKWYRRISTLQEYVLIDAEQISIDCYHRKASGTWELIPVPSDIFIPDLSDTEALQLTSLDFQCPLSLIYEGIDLPDTSPYGFLLNL